MKLYGYWRSSSSWRVRIALTYKGLQWTDVPVHLVRGGGEQHSEEHRRRNPLAQVPVLDLGDGQYIAQSMAILEYLEETYPRPALLPSAPEARAQVRELAEMINSGIQPLQNLALLQRLHDGWQIDRAAWAKSTITAGLDALEARAREGSGVFLVGNSPSIADVCLIPQLYNARRFDCDLGRWPRLLAAEMKSLTLPAFESTRPEKQIDADLAA